MTGRFLLAVLLTLSLAGHVLGQISMSNSLTPTNSFTVTTTSSNSVTVTVTRTTTGSNSLSITPPVPAAPINLTNHFPNCALRPDNTNHIYYLCLAWSDPTGQSVLWQVTYTPTGGAATTVTVYSTYAYLPGLTPDTTYAISIVGVNAAGRSSAALTQSYKTDPTDAKTAYKTKDLLNLNCTNGLSTTFRKVINCGWGSPAVLPSRIDVKGRCVATGAKNKVLHRNLKGSVTTVQLPVHRAAYTCYIEIFGVYLNHRSNNGHGHLFVVSCTTGSTGKAAGCTLIK